MALGLWLQLLALLALLKEVELPALKIRCTTGEYPYSGQCCKNCPAGTYVAEHCIFPSTLGTCRRCTEGEDYTEHENGLEQCLPCKPCNFGFVEVRHCTVKNNTECQCKSGYYCPPGCEECIRCTKKYVHPGVYVVICNDRLGLGKYTLIVLNLRNEEVVERQVLKMIKKLVLPKNIQLSNAFELTATGKRLNVSIIYQPAYSEESTEERSVANSFVYNSIHSAIWLKCPEGQVVVRSCSATTDTECGSPPTACKLKVEFTEEEEEEKRADVEKLGQTIVTFGFELSFGVGAVCSPYLIFLMAPIDRRKMESLLASSKPTEN
ncbi:Tumor necrosis factor receptor superfamily member 22 [Varanus komodoensis]|nr:Tumor necrosis factor receptor superfamily member 22 [Varanus komodoensis]